MSFNGENDALNLLLRVVVVVVVDVVVVADIVVDDDNDDDALRITNAFTTPLSMNTIESIDVLKTKQQRFKFKKAKFHKTKRIQWIDDSSAFCNDSQFTTKLQ